MGRRAVELEPLSASTHVNAGMAFYFGRRFPEAIEGFRTAVHVDPNSVYALFALGLACLSGGAHDEGIAALEKLAAQTDRQMSWALALLGATFAAAGREGDARRILAELDELGKRSYVPPLHFAFVRVQLRETRRDDRAPLARARRSATPSTGPGCRSSQPFDAVRADPRVQELIAAIRPQ